MIILLFIFPYTYIHLSLLLLQVTGLDQHQKSFALDISWCLHSHHITKNFVSILLMFFFFFFFFFFFLICKARWNALAIFSLLENMQPIWKKKDAGAWRSCSDALWRHSHSQRWVFILSNCVKLWEFHNRDVVLYAYVRGCINRQLKMIFSWVWQHERTVNVCCTGRDYMYTQGDT